MLSVLSAICLNTRKLNVVTLIIIMSLCEFVIKKRKFF